MERTPIASTSMAIRVSSNVNPVECFLRSAWFRNFKSALSFLPCGAVPTIRRHTPGWAENSHRPRGHLISRNTGEDSSVNGYTHSSAKTSIAQKLGDRYGGARISRVYQNYWLNVCQNPLWIRGTWRYKG